MIKLRKALQPVDEVVQTYLPRNHKEKKLVEAFSAIQNNKETAAFIRDLLTPVEIEEFANRLEIARLVLAGHSYQEIADETNVSTTTVTRVAQWLFHGCGGYMKVLKKTDPQTPTEQPNAEH